MNKSEVLLKAADIVKGHWIQKGYADDKGNYCLLGAVIKSVHPDLDCAYGEDEELTDNYYETASKVEDIYVPILRKVIDDSYWNLSVWNDEYTRTEEEVIAVLKKAAELVQQEEVR